MSTETASPAPAAATSNFPRPPRGSATGSARFNSSRGPRRGGFSGPRGANSATSKFPPSESTDWASAQDDTADSSEEVAQLKIKYANQLKVLRDVFPDWTAEDLVFALQEVDGDVVSATDRIATGHAAQWGQVKKKPLKEKPKVTGRPEGAAAGTRGRGRGVSDRGTERGGRGRGEGRGSRGRGRGELRGRGRGGAVPASSDATSTAATIASDETPTAWGDIPTMDEAITDTQPKDANGVNGTESFLIRVIGTKSYEEPQQVSAWGVPAKPPSKPQVEEQPAPVNGTATVTPRPPPAPVSSAPTARSSSRTIDPKSSWASIVKPAAPPPAPKPVPPPPQQKPVAPPPQEIPAAPQQSSSRPSTRGQDVIEEPAQTIHDPFTTAEPVKPKVQLPQPALPYIPSLISSKQPQQQQKESPVGPSEPLTSRNLDLLEDQQSPVPEPPTPSVTAHRSSPAPKGDGPPGLSGRFPRPTRENPVVMPGMPSQSLGGMSLQFGSMDLNQDIDSKPQEPKEEPLHQPQELEAPKQPTPSQQRASPAVQQPQPVPSQPQSQRIPSAQGQSQIPQAYQQPAAAGFGGLIPGQARFTAPAPGLTQSKDFSGFPYEQQYQGQTGSGYGDYLYGAGGQGQYELAQREYYNYYQQQRMPPSAATDSQTPQQQRPATQSTTPSNADSQTTPSQFGGSTPAASTTTAPTPTPSTHSQQPHHPQYNPNMNPYWTHPYYANQMYQQHYGGYPYYNQHKGMYGGQGYGGSGYGAQQAGYGADRFSTAGGGREQSAYGAADNTFGRMQYGAPQQQQQQPAQPTGPTPQSGPGMQPHSTQQSTGTGQDDQSVDSSGPTPSQASQASGYPGYPAQSRLPYGLGGTGSQQPQQQQQQQQGGGYQHHYPPQQHSHGGYGGYNPGYNSQSGAGNNVPGNAASQQPSQGAQTSNQSGQRGQQGAASWGQYPH